MKNELMKLLDDVGFYMKISENSRKAIKDKFIFKDYVEFLLYQLRDNDKEIIVQEKDKKKVSDFWGSEENTTSRYGKGFHWVESQIVMERINEKISGDKKVDWVSYVISKYLSGMNTKVCISLGCGSGDLERRPGEERFLG